MKETPQRTIARGVMMASRALLDASFLAGVGPLPEVGVPGALPAWKYNLVPPKDLKLPVHLLMQFAIGDFERHGSCSTYFDPDSPWYNVFYGAYALLSHKARGEPWGFDVGGQPNVDEFLQIARIDYTYLTAGMFGCPPAQMMCWNVRPASPVPVQNGWFSIEIPDATIPSGLHRVPNPEVDYPPAYLMYGIPKAEFLAKGRSPYEEVAMGGRLFMKLLPAAVPAGPITLAWGALCPKTRGGQALLGRIIGAMSPEFLSI